MTQLSRTLITMITLPIQKNCQSKYGRSSGSLILAHCSISNMITDKVIILLIFYKSTASIIYILCILQAFIIIIQKELDSKTISSKLQLYKVYLTHPWWYTNVIVSPKCHIVNDFNSYFISIINKT